jgi:2-polyprenyl-3-methyl-5-hydroxy-6-metoxy-1,4-benzoquinol methylase
MMQSALQRWHELLDARARQMDAAYARLGRSSADYWNRRAHGFHRATKALIGGDPLFLKLRGLSLSQNSVLDVGAGTGRFALALAPLVKQVIAVEPNEAMLNYLRQDAAEQGISTITYIPTIWQDAPADLRADIVICSHVLYPIRDVDVFLAKLRDATRQTCYIYLRATHFDELTASIWRHFHGDERCLPPGYIHALDVMYEMGMYANVEIVKVPQSMRFLSLDEAVGTMQEQLILPDDQRTRDELQSQLANWLVERDGMLTPPVDEMVCAIVSWQP